MKLVASASILSLIILLAALAQGTFSGISRLEANSMLNATSTSLPAILEVWSPDVHSSNITSTTLFPVGGQFTARVNVTNAGPIAGFDVFLNYNLTFGPDVIQAVKTGDELSGGLQIDRVVLGGAGDLGRRRRGQSGGHHRRRRADRPTRPDRYQDLPIHP